MHKAQRDYSLYGIAIISIQNSYQYNISTAAAAITIDLAREQRTVSPTDFFSVVAESERICLRLREPSRSVFIIY